mmetsp:Transcript_47146/g.95013  ORF Transcript_47146/g.95013 Transcript_47146/m.95013 type:complete len:254 (+) Transcript_47146:75-836(+)
MQPTPRSNARCHDPWSLLELYRPESTKIAEQEGTRTCNKAHSQRSRLIEELHIAAILDEKVAQYEKRLRSLKEQKFFCVDTGEMKRAQASKLFDVAADFHQTRLISSRFRHSCAFGFHVPKKTASMSLSRQFPRLRDSKVFSPQHHANILELETTQNRRWDAEVACRVVQQSNRVLYRDLLKGKVEAGHEIDNCVLKGLLVSLFTDYCSLTEEKQYTGILFELEGAPPRQDPDTEQGQCSDFLRLDKLRKISE